MNVLTEPTAIGQRFSGPPNPTQPPHPQKTWAVPEISFYTAHPFTWEFIIIVYVYTYAKRRAFSPRYALFLRSFCNHLSRSSSRAMFCCPCEWLSLGDWGNGGPHRMGSCFRFVYLRVLLCWTTSEIYAVFVCAAVLRHLSIYIYIYIRRHIYI